jgi:hypothetical protein
MLAVRIAGLPTFSVVKDSHQLTDAPAALPVRNILDTGSATSPLADAGARAEVAGMTGSSVARNRHDHGRERDGKVTVEQQCSGQLGGPRRTLQSARQATWRRRKRTPS